MEKRKAAKLIGISSMALLAVGVISLSSAPETKTKEVIMEKACASTYHTHSNHNDWTEVSSAQSLYEAVNMFRATQIYLTSDITYSANSGHETSIQLSSDLDICLNGHTLTNAANDNQDNTDLFDNRGYNLNIYDETGTGKIALTSWISEGPWGDERYCGQIEINNGSFNLYGGTIEAGANNGAIFSTYQGSTVNIYGGTIKQNSGADVFGFIYDTLNFNMTGGTIIGTQNSKVFTRPKLIGSMTGGTIQNFRSIATGLHDNSDITVHNTFTFTNVKYGFWNGGTNSTVRFVGNYTSAFTEYDYVKTGSSSGTNNYLDLTGFTGNNLKVCTYVPGPLTTDFTSAAAAEAMLQKITFVDTGGYITKVSGTHLETLRGCSVKVNVDGTTKKTFTVVSGDTVDLSAYTPNKTRHTLLGYDKDSDGVVDYLPTDVVTVTANMTLNAVFQANTCQFSGTEITGTGTAEDPVVSTIPATKVLVAGDTYLNTTTFDMYAYNGTTWTYLGNLKGAKGDTGATGATGATGSQGPQGDKGDKGDTGATGSQGPQGPAGSDGQPGANGSDGQPGKDGADFLTGKGAPAATLGKDGDTYLDTETYELYTKASGTWTLKGSIKGSDAAQPDKDGLNNQAGGATTGLIIGSISVNVLVIAGLVYLFLTSKKKKQD